MLVDDLAGTGHRLYGLLPNMTYLIGRGGRVLFRADWTDPPTIEQAIRYLLDARDRRREGLSLKPFYAEFLGYRWSSQAAFMAGLEVAGPQAVSDFRAAMDTGPAARPQRTHRRRKFAGSPSLVLTDWTVMTTRLTTDDSSAVLPSGRLTSRPTAAP